MKLGRKIAEGSTSEIYKLENSNKIIKLAKPTIHPSDLQREYKNTSIAWELGLSVPRAYEVATIDGRSGIVFEHIHGETLTERFVSLEGNQPEINWDDVRKTAQFLAEIHQLSHAAFRPQRELLTWKIERVTHLSEDERNAVLGLLNKLPVKNRICHGDPNPNNMVISDGKLVIIDWNDATSGNPEADLAEYIIMIKYAVLPPSIPTFFAQLFDSAREKIIKVFLDEYTRLTGITFNDVEPWIAPIAARKLTADAISEEEKQLLVSEIKSLI